VSKLPYNHFKTLLTMTPLRVILHQNQASLFTEGQGPKPVRSQLDSVITIKFLYKVLKHALYGAILTLSSSHSSHYQMSRQRQKQKG
jgi:hypothetical protein